MRDSKAMERKEKERRLKIVQDGMGSEYWNLLKEKVEEDIATEERWQDQFKRKGIAERHIDQYNQSVNQVFFMRQFLEINNNLCGDYQSFLEKAKDYVESFWNKTTSFVGRVGNE